MLFTDSNIIYNSHVDLPNRKKNYTLNVNKLLQMLFH